jgi:hypothetical protein
MESPIVNKHPEDSAGAAVQARHRRSTPLSHYGNVTIGSCFGKAMFFINFYNGSYTPA